MKTKLVQNNNLLSKKFLQIMLRANKMKLVITALMVITACLSEGKIIAQDLVMATRFEKAIENSPETEAKKTFEFYTYSQTENLKKYDNLRETHFLGFSIARKYSLFNDTYSVKTPISPGSPTMRISIRKPVIYTSVKKIEKQLKKSINKKVLTTEDAAKIFDKVLDVAITIISDPTEDFEKEIHSSASVDALIDLYIHRVNLKYMD